VCSDHSVTVLRRGGVNQRVANISSQFNNRSFYHLYERKPRLFSRCHGRLNVTILHFVTLLIFGAKNNKIRVSVDLVS